MNGSGCLMEQESFIVRWAHLGIEQGSGSDCINA